MKNTHCWQKSIIMEALYYCTSLKQVLAHNKTDSGIKNNATCGRERPGLPLGQWCHTARLSGTDPKGQLQGPRRDRERYLKQNNIGHA